MTQQEKVTSVQGDPSVLEHMDDEQLEVVRTRTGKLCSEDGDINMAATMLLTSQRLYAMARGVLQRQLAVEGVEWADGVEECVIKAMRAKAYEPFSLEEMFKQCQGPVLDFTGEELRRSIEERRSEQLATRRAEEEGRLGASVPVCHNDEPIMVPVSGGVLMFVGTMNDVIEAISDCTRLIERHNYETTDGWKYNIVRFGSGIGDAPRIKIAGQKDDKRSINISPDQWKGVLNKRSLLEKIVSKWSRSLTKNRCDVLVTSNVSQAFVPTFAGRAEHSNVNDAIKTITRWAEDSHTAVIGGIVVPEDEDNFQQELTDKSGKHVQFVWL
jgi:hypothetical protein